MARKTDDDEAPKKKSGAEKHLAVWLLLAMIVTGFGGWGVANFGNSVTSIGKVGTVDIASDDYARSLRSAIQNFSRQIGSDVSLQMAQQLGIDRQVLQGIVLRTAMDAENARLGLSVGDAVVAQEVKSNRAFQGAGGFDRQTYKATLEQNGLTEKAYEAGLRSDVARRILQGAVTGGLRVPESLATQVYAYRAEKRGFSLLHLTEAGLPAPIAAPTDADLQAYYDAHAADFTRPAGKRITYAALLPETLAPTMPADEAAVRKLYDDRADQYNVPEKRLVERLVYPTEDEAKAAWDQLQSGKATFPDLVKARGLELTDVDMGDVSQTDLGEAGAAVFKLAQGESAGPLPSALGPAIYRVNGILAAQVTPFDQVKADLTKEVQVEAAKKAIADKVEAVDDALAGGATLDDLVKEQGMVKATTDYAPGASDNDPITEDKGFAAEAAKLAVGDYAEAAALDNGGLVAMQIDADLPAAPIPFDKVKDKVAAAWHAEALQKALEAQAADAKSKVEGGAGLGGFGIVSVVQPLTRDQTLTDAPAEALRAVFALAPGQVQVVATPGWVGLVRLDSVVPAPTDGDAAHAAREDIAAELRQGLVRDVTDLYGAALLAQDKVSLDQAAINAVNASFR